MSAKSKSKASEAQQLLDSLDSLGTGNSNANPSNQAKASGKPGGEAEALAFLDEITQKSEEPAKASIERPLSRAGTPTLRKSTERVKLGGGSSTTSLLPSSNKGDGTQSKAKAAVAAANAANENSRPASPAKESSGGAWGWGSVWSSASAAIQQARTVVDEQVKQLPQNENVRKWGEGALEYAKTAQLDKLGQDFKRVGLSTLTDILNVVAPPISEHEVIQVTLSHDMQGYEGIESLVYRSMAKVMEQVQGGDLVVNRGNESKPKEGSEPLERDLNTVDGYDAAVKLARANLTELIAANAKAPPPKTATIESPTTYSNVYLRVQPFFTNVSSQVPATEGQEAQTQQQLQFLLYFSDPTHELTHINLTQTIPSSWLAVWDTYEWVEDLVAEAIRISVEVIGQDYLVQRMGWANKTEKTANNPEDGQQGADASSDVDKDTVIVNADS